MSQTRLSPATAAALHKYEAFANQLVLLSQNLLTYAEFLTNLEEGLRASTPKFEAALAGLEAVLPDLPEEARAVFAKGIPSMRKNWELILALPFNTGVEFAKAIQPIKDHHTALLKEYAQTNPEVN